MSTFSVSCPECGTKYNLHHEVAGKKLRCATCRGVFIADANGFGLPVPPVRTQQKMEDVPLLQADNSAHRRRYNPLYCTVGWLIMVSCGMLAVWFFRVDTPMNTRAGGALDGAQVAADRAGENPNMFTVSEYAVAYANRLSAEDTLPGRRIYVTGEFSILQDMMNAVQLSDERQGRSCQVLCYFEGQDDFRRLLKAHGGMLGSGLRGLALTVSGYYEGEVKDFLLGSGNMAALVRCRLETSEDDLNKMLADKLTAEADAFLAEDRAAELRLRSRSEQFIELQNYSDVFFLRNQCVEIHTRVERVNEKDGWITVQVPLNGVSFNTFFHPRHKDELAALRPGKTVIIRGVAHGMQGIRNCILMK